MKVTSVTIAQQGLNRNGKPYIMYKATLDNGQEPTGFDQVKVGDEVETFMKGKYLNYSKAGFADKNGQPTADPKRAMPGVVQYNGRSPETQARIERQHSQEMALRLISFARPKEALKNNEEVASVLRYWTDHFQADLDNQPAKAEPDDAPARGRLPDPAVEEGQKIIRQAGEILNATPTKTEPTQAASW